MAFFLLTITMPEPSFCSFVYDIPPTDFKTGEFENIISDFCCATINFENMFLKCESVLKDLNRLSNISEIN